MWPFASHKHYCLERSSIGPCAEVRAKCGQGAGKVPLALDIGSICCSSLNIIRVIKSRSMRRVGHVARKGRGEVYTGFWCGKLRERGHLEDPGVDGMIAY